MFPFPMQPPHHRPEETVSWFMAMSDFGSKTINSFSNAVYNLTSCVRMPMEDDYRSRYHHRRDEAFNQANIRALSMAQENRDSMNLLAAIFTGRESKARELLELPWTNINAQYANGNTALILAIQGQSETIIRLLLDHPDINVNLRGMDGYTALIRACQERSDFVRLLVLRADTNVNMATYYGTTALTYAVRCGNEDAIQYLLMRYDLDVNFQSRCGENALLEAISYRRFEIAHALITRPGTNVDILDFRDRSPLILAVQSGYLPLMRLLLYDAMADTSVEDDHGHNALYYALKRESAHMAHEILAVMSMNPLPLARICRLVIRRHLMKVYGRGNRLKPYIEKFKPYEVPKIMKKFLAYDSYA